MKNVRMQFIIKRSELGRWMDVLAGGALLRRAQELGFGAELDVIDFEVRSVCEIIEFVAMAGSAGAATVKDVADDPKLDVFEDDDEFEEFENEVWDDEDEGKGALQQWEDDWDDDDVTDDFSVQLKRELEAEK